MTEDIREKVRAVFLASLMVMSVIAMTATFSGAAAASNHVDETTVNDISIGGGYGGTGGLTIIDDVPRNGSSVYDNATPLYDGNGGKLSISPLNTVTGSHMGLVGVPVQTDTYEAYEGFLNWQQRNAASPALEPTQSITIDFDVIADSDTDEETITVDYGPAVEAGLEINETATAARFGTLDEQLDTDADGTGDIGDGANELIGAQSGIDNAAGEISLTYENNNDGSDTVTLQVVWEPEDPVEGLDVEGTSQNPEDSSLDHVLRGPDGETTQSGFKVLEVGATALTYADTDSGFIGGNADTIDLDAETEADGVDQGPGNGAPDTFHTWQGQVTTFITENNTDNLRIWEVATEDIDGDDNPEYQRGDLVERLGTAPGKATNYDTSRLEPGQYFVTFADNRKDALVLDVAPLNLQADAPESVTSEDDIEIDVESQDFNDQNAEGMVEAWFWEAGDDEIGEVIHVERAELDGNGATTIRANPQADLNGNEDYYAAVVHKESEVVQFTDTIEVTEAQDEKVTIESPRPGEGDTFQRGDIVPITLNFQNTDTGTITFGDRQSGQSIEINVTVRDADEDGKATVYMNTFQTGDGPVVDPDSGQVVEADTLADLRIVTPAGYQERVGTQGNPDSYRNHGFFTNPDNDDTVLIGQDGQEAVAHAPSLDIGGGPAGLGVLAATGYDLVSTAGEESYKNTGVTVDDRSIVRLEQRNTQGMQVWTAPGLGENELDAEFAEDVQEGIENELITPADGTIADKDYYILQIQSTGLEGLLHEAVILNDSLDVDDFLAQTVEREDSEANHIITDAFFSTDLVRDQATGTLSPVLSATTIQTNTGPNEEAAVLDLPGQSEGVIAATDDSGNLDEYFIPMYLEAGSSSVVLPLDKELETGMSFFSEFTVEPVSGDQFLTPNEPLARLEDTDDDGNLEPTETQQSLWEFVDDVANVDRDGDVLTVPKEDNVTIEGTTNVAAGTNLTVNLVTTPGQDDPFFKPNTAFSQYVAGQPNSWEITEDFGDIDVGTQFEINIIRSGAAGTITPTGSPIPGVVTAEPAVNEFTFEDQRSGGQSVVVQTFNTTQGGYIAIEDADGNRIGWSSFQSIGEQTNVPISLDTTLEENQEVTAVAYRTQDRPYTDENGDRITASAMVEVEDVQPANFQVSELSPQNAELDEPGPTVEVSATVENTGDANATQTVELQIDGSTADSTEVSLAGGESTTVTLSASTGTLSYGTTYVHSIVSADDEASGALTIAEEPTPEPTATPTPEPTATPTPEPTPTDTPEPADTDTPTPSDDDGAGFGIAIGLLALLGAALLAVRRQTRE